MPYIPYIPFWNGIEVLFSKGIRFFKKLVPVSDYIERLKKSPKYCIKIKKIVQLKTLPKLYSLRWKTAAGQPVVPLPEPTDKCLLPNEHEPSLQNWSGVEGSLPPKLHIGGRTGSGSWPACGWVGGLPAGNLLQVVGGLPHQPQHAGVPPCRGGGGALT